MHHQKVGWVIFAVLVSRTIFAVLYQGIVSWGTRFTVEELDFLAVGRWWTVYGSLIDISCFILLTWVKVRGNQH